MDILNKKEENNFIKIKDLNSKIEKINIEPKTKEKTLIKNKIKVNHMNIKKETNIKKQLILY